jgi:D-amino-acid oxidase
VEAGVDTLVVGAGVIGLSVGIRLREAGVDAHVVAAERLDETTSSVAAALWYPYRALPRERVTAWSRETYADLVSLADHGNATGVRLVPGRELVRDAAGDPWWRDAVPGVGHAPPDELPEGYEDGWVLDLPVVDMTRYLPWLERRLASLGGEIVQRRIGSLDEALAEARTVVNCAGLAAAALAADHHDVVPVRGQVVVVERTRGVDEWLLDQSDERALTYVVPREETIVLGGTADVGSTDMRPDPATAGLIRARCTTFVPALADARVLEHRVGLRPGRSAVRLELERRPQGIVVHCYGHGGAGVTLSWGCAAEVVRVYLEALNS